MLRKLKLRHQLKSRVGAKATTNGHGLGGLEATNAPDTPKLSLLTTRNSSPSESLIRSTRSFTVITKKHTKITKSSIAKR